MEENLINHKIRIHYIDSPCFTYNGIEYTMRTEMIRNFAGIDTLIKKHLKHCEKHNLTTEMAILSITNMSGDKLIEATTGEYIPFIRYSFFPSAEGQMPIPKKIN